MRHGRGLLPLWPAWVCRPSVCQASQAPRLDTSNPQPKGTQVSNNPGCTSCQLPAFGLVSELCRGDRAHPQSLGLRDSHLLLRCGGHCPCTDLCGRVGASSSHSHIESVPVTLSTSSNTDRFRMPLATSTIPAPWFMHVRHRFWPHLVQSGPKGRTVTWFIGRCVSRTSVFLYSIGPDDCPNAPEIA